MEERLEKQLEFALLIDKEKNVFRQTHLSGHGRRENDAEHAVELFFVLISAGRSVFCRIDDDPVSEAQVHDAHVVYD